MLIKLSKKQTKSLSAFNKNEWPLADIEHYGQVLDWKKKLFTLVAYENKNIVGTLGFKIEVGVAYIGTLIVAKSVREKGIGRQLMERVEHIARECGAHKIYLQTGKTWNSIQFYEKLGYKITGELPNHYNHQDFVEVSKFI